MTQAHLPEAGVVLNNRYLLQEVIGEGATSYVYKALDQLLEQRVAIKVISLEEIGKEVGVEGLGQMLRKEAVASMRLSHPNILRVYNYERHEPWEFLVMELIEGEHLGRIVRQRSDRRIPPRQLVKIMLDSLNALSYAHGLGVIHNDLKPSNIMIHQKAHLKICDFGLAQISAQKTEQGAVIAGTPPFMCPERIMGEEGTPASDIYSLAATLYTLGHGEPPFGREMNKALKGHLRKPFPERSKLPRALHAIFGRAMEKRPEDRYPSAEAMAAEARVLYGILQGDEPPLYSPSWAPAPSTPTPRDPSAPPRRTRTVTLPPPIDAAPSGPASGEIRRVPVPSSSPLGVPGQPPGRGEE
ncbi:protein kinase [Myxococcota bacterium]|nr:protein kinase [Myxococcota bacterium]